MVQDRQALELLEIGPEELSRLPFHDPRFLQPLLGQATRQALSEVVGLPGEPNALGYILGHGYCGSTVVSRAIEGSLSAVVLREPYVLTQLADSLQPFQATTGKALNEPISLDELKSVITLYRRFSRPTSLIIKLHQRCCFMLDWLMSAAMPERVIILYHRLPLFISHACATQGRRKAVRDDAIRAHLITAALSSGPKIEELIFPEKAAAYFWAQFMVQTLSLLEHLGGGRVRFCSADELIRRRGEQLEFTLDGMFPPDSLASVPNSPWWKADAKQIGSTPDEGLHLASGPLPSKVLVDDAIRWVRGTPVWRTLVEKARRQGTLHLIGEESGGRL